MHFLRIVPRHETPPTEELTFDVVDERAGASRPVLTNATGDEAIRYIGEQAASREMEGRQKVVAGHLQDHARRLAASKPAAPAKPATVASSRA